MDRRSFLSKSAAGSVSLMMPFGAPATSPTSLKPTPMEEKSIASAKLTQKSGFGGVAIGNGFQVNPDGDCIAAVQAAWDAGVRFFDTSPWYGLGISERRLGLALSDKPKDAYTVSTKIGRILHPHEDFDVKHTIWKGKVNFRYTYDYSAEGVRKSVEDSLQRLGLSSLDIVFIHDLSPDNGDMKEDWVRYFDVAAKGAMPELTKMREEGIIKGWGFGVNTIEPILKAMEVSDPNVFLSACQYSLIKHEDLLERVFPKVAARDISMVVGAPLCAGFLSGKDRYLYGGTFPDGVREKLADLKRVAANHQVDLRTAALQFSAAPDTVSAVIPGAHTVQQVEENAASFTAVVPSGFWEELKQEKLIAADAPVPKV